MKNVIRKYKEDILKYFKYISNEMDENNFLNEYQKFYPYSL
jgi:hypothetical protein